MTIEKIWITGNILGNTEEARTNALILEATLFFRRLIESVTGLEVRPFYMQKEARTSYGMPIDVGWENNEGPLQQNTSEYVWNCFQGSLVIAYAPGLLERYLEALRIPYIALRLSALGFLEDLHYAFYSNVPTVCESFMQYRIPEEEIAANAQRQKLYYELQPRDCAIKQHALLFCGGGEAEAAVAMPDTRYREKVTALLETYEHIYYKSLGGAQGYAKRDAWMQEYYHVYLVDTNLYRLLCDERIIAVASAYNGILEEAAYFEKRLHLLLKESGSAKASKWVLLRSDYFTSAFWADVLSGILKTTPGNWHHFWAPDVLRSTTGRQGAYELGGSREAVWSLQQVYDSLLEQSDVQAVMLQSMGGIALEKNGMRLSWKERLYIKKDIANLRLHINGLRAPFSWQRTKERMP